MDRLEPLARRARELAEALEGLTEYREPGSWLTPHPDTAHLIRMRGLTREQLSYSVPEELELRRRVAAFDAEHGKPGSGNVVAAALDAYLRAHGYPPPTQSDEDVATALESQPVASRRKPS